MEIDAKATSISIKVIGLKLKQPNAKQEQADSANSQNSRYQSRYGHNYFCRFSYEWKRRYAINNRHLNLLMH